MIIHIGSGSGLVSDKLVGIILCMRLAYERRRYNLTSFPIGWTTSQNDHWVSK